MTDYDILVVGVVHPTPHPIPKIPARVRAQVPCAPCHTAGCSLETPKSRVVVRLERVGAAPDPDLRRASAPQAHSALLVRLPPLVAPTV